MTEKRAKKEGQYLFALVFGVAVFCLGGSALALPQDWGCEPIMVTALEKVQNDVGEAAIRYVGDSGDVRLEISFLTDETGKADLDCGNQGCVGRLENVATGMREEMNFYCEFENHEEVSCAPVNWRMLVLNLAGEGKYELAMCGGAIVYRLDMSQCAPCECALERQDSSKKATKVLMTCATYQQDGAKVVCLDGYGMDKYAEQLGGFEKCLQ